MITNLFVKNFKILNEIDLAFSNLILIAGKNSVGKSSLIQVLLLLRQSFEKNTLLREGLLLQGDYLKIGKGQDILSSSSLDEIFHFSISFDDGSDLDLKYTYKAFSDLQPLLEHKTNLKDLGFLNNFSVFNKNFRYLSAERISPETSYPVSDFHINTLNSIGINGQFTAHFLAEYENKIIEFENLIHSKGISQTLLVQVSAWMSEISDGIKVGAKKAEDLNSASLTYEFSTQDGYTNKFSPKNVGFGLTYVLPVVTSLLSAQKGDLLIIENPEAHLHPAGQSAMGKLISLVAQNGVQVIIETHSDHLLNGVRNSVGRREIEKENISIFYFSKDENLINHDVEIKTPVIDERGRIDEWPKGFFDEWDNQLDELINI